jgi:hypothetical protein
MITITTFKGLIPGKLGGTSLAKISGIYGKMYEAAANMRGRVKPRTIARSSRIENAIYDHVYNYTCPDDLEDDAVIDIRPIGERSTEDTMGGTGVKEFDIKKKGNTFVVEYVNGQKTLRISKPAGTHTVLHRMDSTTTGGTVTLGGDASNATIDTLDHVSGSGALKFNLNGLTGTATVTIALDTVTDLSDMRSLGALFAWVKFPDSSRLTSVKLTWGASAGEGWYKTVTTAHDRAFTSNAWQLLRHDWTSATDVGAPTETTSETIDYVQVTFTYTVGTALSGVGLDNITASLGKAYEVVYYSNRIFTDTTGITWKETPTHDTDIIRLEPLGTNIFMYEFMLTLQQELQGENMSANFAFFRNQLEGNEKRAGLYDQFERQNPDQSMTRDITYYEFGTVADSDND